MVERASPSLRALDLLYRRRATRAFTDDRIGDSAVRELLRAAVHAPTAMHLEPWAFVIVQDPAVLARINARAKTLALARSPAPRIPALFSDPSVDIFYGATTLIVICAKPLGPFAAADCWLAAEKVMLAATAMGLATCPIGFARGALADPVLAAELGIPRDVTPVAPIIVGVPSGKPPASSRRAPEILSWKKPT